jgi:competence protein ComEA
MKMTGLVLRCGLGLGFALAAAGAHGQQLPDGADKDLFVKTCSKCHEIERVLSQRQDAGGWTATVDKMQGYGLVADDADLKRIIAYLSTNLPAQTITKLNVNTAEQIDLEAALSLKRSVAGAIIAYREKNGPFKSLDDLKKVPGVDAAVVDDHKAKLTL